MTLVHLPHAASTNDEARKLALGGAPHGTAVAAERQTQGRGRLGRTWVSVDGSVALSIVVRPRLPPEQIPLLCLAAAVATARCCGPKWRIAWPNDVIGPDGQGKVAGILAEAEWSGGTLRFVVLGIGVNVEAAPVGVGAASLADLGPPPDRAALSVALVREVLAEVDRLSSDGPLPLLDAWRARSATLGQRVLVGDLAGEAVDIDDGGALLVRDAGGVQRRILAGDVVMVAERGR